MNPILYLDMDNVLVDFQSGLDCVLEDVKRQYADDGSGKPHYDDIPGIFSLMKPMPDAVEAVKTLSEKYDLFILSTAPWNNPSAWADKVEWVKKYFDSNEKTGVFYKRMILTHHKDLCYRPNAWLVDDRTKNGADAFGDHLIHFGSTHFPDWKSVVDFLMK